MRLFPAEKQIVSTRHHVSLADFLTACHTEASRPDTSGITDQIARREAWEEIGLPVDDTKLPAPFRIEHLCYLPYNLARTELIVRPCVALLHSAPPPVPTAAISASPTTDAASPLADDTSPNVEDSLIPRLDAKEVAAVFSAPFHNFLRKDDEAAPSGTAPPAGKWYEGSWTHWHEEPWRMHFFYVPVRDQRVTKPRVRDGGLAAIGEHAAPGEGFVEGEEDGRYKVWGMTARILVDAATVAYGEKPEFEHNSHFGDEKIIEALEKMGRLQAKKKPDSVFSNQDLKKASDASKM
jgi:8-oxo-dGTP pyrophosphatase MutT (NUDIX family)